MDKLRYFNFFLISVGLIFWLINGYVAAGILWVSIFISLFSPEIAKYVFKEDVKNN